STNTMLDMNAQWPEIVNSLRNRQMIYADNNACKSTLLRYLINKKLKTSPKVLLIDLDIGKSEMFLPQTISATVITKPLLGPGFLNKESPQKSYYFEDVTFSDNRLITKYFNCVLRLIHFCINNPELVQLPWIVSTMGYNRGEDVSCEKIR